MTPVLLGTFRSVERQAPTAPRYRAGLFTRTMEDEHAAIAIEIRLVAGGQQERHGKRQGAKQQAPDRRATGVGGAGFPWLKR